MSVNAKKQFWNSLLSGTEGDSVKDVNFVILVWISNG